MLALEVVPLPVADVDRALAFYTERAGFVLDVDYRPSPEFRVVQLTPPGSACSVQLVAADSRNRLQNLCLVTDDLEAERAALIGRGVDVGTIRHKHPVETWVGRASRTSPTRTATPGLCRNGVTARRDRTRRNERSATMGLSWQQGVL
jgi:hypothetical protein